MPSDNLRIRKEDFGNLSVKEAFPKSALTILGLDIQMDNLTVVWA